MATIISASIDLDKIDKAKITIGKNGHRYYQMSVFINDEANKYGKDVSISENQTADERAAKKSKNYIGDGKVVWKSEFEQKPKADEPNTENTSNNSSDDLPF